jgi:hypothetical protein
VYCYLSLLYVAPVVGVLRKCKKCVNQRRGRIACYSV